jgi:hypothetical protein
MTTTHPKTVAVPTRERLYSKDGETYSVVSAVLRSALVHTYRVADDFLLTIRVVETSGKVTTIHDHTDVEVAA